MIIVIELGVSALRTKICCHCINIVVSYSIDILVVISDNIYLRTITEILKGDNDYDK